MNQGMQAVCALTEFEDAASHPTLLEQVGEICTEPSHFLRHRQRVVTAHHLRDPLLLSECQVLHVQAAARPPGHTTPQKCEVCRKTLVFYQAYFRML